MASELERKVDKLTSEVRVAGVFTMAAGYAGVGEDLPDDLVRVIRYLMRGYPPAYQATYQGD